MRHTFRPVSILLLLLTSLLTGCGFHLRGEMGTGSDIKQLSVTGNHPIYIRELSRAIERSGIVISDQAPWRINIIRVERSTDQQGVASAGSLEQRIAMDVAYQWQSASGLGLFAPVQLTRERYITQQQDAPNAAEYEQSVILGELQQELIAVTLRRIHSHSEAELAEEAKRVRAATQSKAHREERAFDGNTRP